jgi:outer membrane lipase/esterase
MKTKKRIIPALVLSLFAAFGSATASAAQFSNVYVFGDSLSDAGFYRPTLLASGVPASLVATLGRFTINPGPVWSELVSAHYGVVNPGPSNAGGAIYAQGGARVTLPSASQPANLQRQVSTQITEYLATGGGAADPSALYAVFAGGNDMLQNIGLFSAGAITAAQFQANVLAAATAEIGQIARLQGAGARYILVFGLPDVGGTPAVLAAGAATAASITQLSAGFNTTLFTGVQSAGLKVIPVDLFGLFTDVRANASAFGFTNTTGTACLPFPPFSTSSNSQFCTNANIVADGQSYFFADSVHPTPRAQAIIADYVESLIDGPAMYSLLPEAAIRSRSSHVRSVAEGARSTQLSEGNRFGAFVSADGGTFDVEAGQGLTGLQSRNNSITVGVAARASENVTVGAAFGRSRANANFNGGLGGYQLRDTSYTLFAGYRGANLYGSAAFSNGNLDYNGMSRNIRLGSVTRIGESHPSGSNASFFANLGYDLNFGRLQVGPTVGYATQGATVQAFDETPVGTTSLTGMLSIGEQTRRSEIWSVGGKASYSFGAWTPWVRVTVDKETRDEARFVQATVRALGAVGGVYDIEAYAPDTSFVTTSFGIRGKVNDWVSLGVAYTRISGRSGIKEDGITGAVAIRF